MLLTLAQSWEMTRKVARKLRSPQGFLDLSELPIREVHPPWGCTDARMQNLGLHQKTVPEVGQGRSCCVGQQVFSGGGKKRLLSRWGAGGNDSEAVFFVGCGEGVPGLSRGRPQLYALRGRRRSTIRSISSTAVSDARLKPKSVFRRKLSGSPWC